MHLGNFKAAKVEEEEEHELGEYENMSKLQNQLLISLQDGNFSCFLRVDTGWANLRNL